MTVSARVVTPLRRTLTFSAIGLTGTLAVGLGLIAAGHGRSGWWLVTVAVTGSLIVAGTVIRGQRTLTRLSQSAVEGGPGDNAGNRPAPGSAAPLPAPQRRWVAAASVPGALGYMDVGPLLAVAELDERGLVLRVRPAFIRLMFGFETWTVRPGDGAVIFPAYKFGQSGIGIRMSGRPTWYFWSRDRARMLASLTAAGFPVSGEEERMRR